MTGRISDVPGGNTVRQNGSGRFDAIAALFWGSAAVLFCVLSQDTLRWWWWEWTRPQGFYSHGILVPPLAAIVLWHYRDRAPVKPGNLWFVLPLTVCIAGYIFAEREYMRAAQSALFLGTIASVTGLIGGGNWLRRVALPALALLTLSAPLPGPLLHDATGRLQDLSARGAQLLLNGCGFAPVIRTGTVLRLPQYTLDVDTPCSGLQTLLTAVTLALALALLSDITRLGKTVLLLLAVPVAILANILRIAVIGVIGECFGATAAHSLHDTSGLLGTLLCSGFLLLALWRMGCHRLAGQRLF